MSKDYYKTLGVDKSATADDIKSAYRKLAIKHHPDRNQGDKASEEKFKEITEAYEVLKDPQKKTMYDQGAYNPQGGGFGGGAGGFGGGFSQEGFSDIFSDIFSSFGDIFGGGFSGGGARSQQQQRGNNLVYEIMISLEEAFAGIKKEIKIKSLYSCDVCSGKGTTSNQGFEDCKTCGGKGRVIVNRGFLRIEQTCTTCKGTGKTIKDPCKNCGGDGRVKKEKKLIIDIPAGIDEGMKIRLSGEGEAGARGAQNGDLFVAVHVANHKFFKREESNLYLSVSIPFVFAALGKVIEIPSISGGVIELKIPEGTQNGQKFRLKGQGMKGLNSKYYGDMYVDISVEIPTSLTKEQKKALESHFQEVSDKVVVTNN